jgi:hypothetical protein
MPFTQNDLDELPIYFCRRPGEVWVTVGSCSAKAWKNNKIPLDGRQYKCAGTIILRNGKKLRASFSITTTDFDFIIMDSLYIPVNGTWYRWDEPELLTALNITKEEFVPYKWMPDKPLDYHVKGPYIINERLIKSK